jgi:hypothetical protein
VIPGDDNRMSYRWLRATRHLPCAFSKCPASRAALHASAMLAGQVRIVSYSRFEQRIIMMMCCRRRLDPPYRCNWLWAMVNQAVRNILVSFLAGILSTPCAATGAASWASTGPLPSAGPAGAGAGAGPATSPSHSGGGLHGQGSPGRPLSGSAKALAAHADNSKDGKGSHASTGIQCAVCLKAGQ